MGFFLGLFSNNPVYPLESTKAWGDHEKEQFTETYLFGSDVRMNRSVTPSRLNLASLDPGINKMGTYSDINS